MRLGMIVLAAHKINALALSLNGENASGISYKLQNNVTHDGGNSGVITRLPTK